MGLRTALLWVVSGLMLVSCKSDMDPGPTFEASVGSLHPSGDGGDTLYVPEGLQAEVWAESPMFYNPTNMDVDARGRIWVTEAVDYRDFRYKDQQGYKHFPEGDRVVILEDTNGDGRADTSKVFVQDKDLQAPLGIAVIGKKVIVSSSPSVIVYTDEDGDDKPDRKETFLTGFGGYDHDHGLHAVVAGPDGKWYLNAGNAGPHNVTDQAGWTLRAGSIYTGGTPYNTDNTPGMVSDDGRVWVGGVALRVNPDGTGLKVMGHNFRNSYEIALDSFGNMWQNDNDDEVQACRTTWLMEGSNAGYFSRNGSRYWRADRRPGQEIPEAHWHQGDPGVLPSGDITGAGAPTGIMVYESDRLGSEYEGMLLSADAGRNEIFAYMPEKKGAGYQLDRHKLVSSVRESTAEYVWYEEVGRDKWFRPSDIVTGTDGALYIADWYDPVVGGHQMNDKEGYGRIYRIFPEDKTLAAPEIDLTTTKGQINALLSPAVNVRYSGFQRLQARGKEVLPEVKQVLSSGKPYHRARAVWLLANMGPEGIAEVEQLLNDPDEDIRITAFRALRQARPQQLLEYARGLSKDTSAQVRRAVAIAMRDIPLEESRDIIMNLVEGYQSGHRWYLNALGIALDGKEEQIYPVLKEKLANNAPPVEWPANMADLVWELHPEAAVDDLKLRATVPGLSQEQRAQAMTALGFIHTPEAAEAMIALGEHSNASVSNDASWWLQYRKTNEWQELLDDWEAPPPEHPLEKHPEMVELGKVVTNQSMALSERRKAAQKMARDSTGGLFLVGMAAQNRLSAGVKDAVADEISDNPDRYIQILAEEYFDSSSSQKDYETDQITSLEASASKGRIQFNKHCIICHSNGEGGGQFGPSLADIGGKMGKRELLESIIDPGAAVQFGFEPWLVTTQDGKAAYGMLLTNGDIVVLKDIQGNRHIFESGNIEYKVRLSTSIMPGAAHLELNEQDLADLTRYLVGLQGNRNEVN